MTRALAVTRFELSYQLGRASTRIYLAIFLSVAALLTWFFIVDAREDGYFFNAPIITIAITVITSMIALLIAAGVAGDAATRDIEARMDSLVFTTPLSKLAYLGGRFAGAFGVTALLLAAVPIALLLSSRLPLEPELVGPFRPAAYLVAYFVLAIPNAFVATAVLFSFAALSRNAIASYAGAAILFFSAFVCEGLIAFRLGNWGLARLLDPLAYTTVHGTWRSLNPLQRNTMLGLDPSLLTNRLLWLSVAIVLLALTFFRFRFAHGTAGAGSKRFIVERDPVPAQRWTRTAIASLKRDFNSRTRVRQILAITMRSFRELVTSRGWFIVPLVAIVFVLTAPPLLEVELGTPGAATTGRLAVMIGGTELARLIMLLITLSAGVLVWRERDARIDAIADTVPVPEWITVAGKFLSIALMLAATQLIFLIAGVGVQVTLGHYDFDLPAYITILFVLYLVPYLLCAALAMLIHVVVNQKYVANVVAFLTFIGLEMAREVGVRHNLLIYGGAPDWSYSEMGGFGLQLAPWRWFTFYWSGWATLFAVLTYLFWIRGEERGLRARLSIARSRLTRWPAAIAAVAIAVIGGVGGFVYYNTNVLNRYYTDWQLDERAAEYERRYGKFRSVAQPILAATKLHVDFYPERSAASIRGTYHLQNRSAAAIDTIHVVTNTSVSTNDVSFDRPSKLQLDDRELGYHIYALSRAVRPGESVMMNFRIEHSQRGFTNFGRNESVMPNGSWIQHRPSHSHGARQWLPFVGYQTNRELNAAGVRREHGLRERPAVPLLNDVAARQDQRGIEKIDLETIIGTEADQVGVAPGVLRRSWTENGRRYFHYATDAPITNGFAIYSANYAVHRARWRDVNIDVFHHPAHAQNLARIVRSVSASLEYHADNYSPYPHKQIHVVEYPSSGRELGLTAYPAMIEYTEGFALVRPQKDARQIDVPFAVMAHEIGHQWWGHQIVPAFVEGAPVLSESLAWYSAMLTIEKTLGRDHLIRLLDVMRAEYMAPHQTRDVPLLRTFNRFDAYRTGPFAMFTLRETVGVDRVNAALRNLLAKFDPARPPYPTSLDLYAELRAVTPPSMHYLLKDLFEEITFWDLRARKVDAQPSGGGNYRVTLHIDAHKLKADPLGREKPVPMDDAIEVAVFDADGRTLYRQSHRIHSGAQTISVDVPRAPFRAAIDPDHELLDRSPEDNAADVGTAGG